MLICRLFIAFIGIILGLLRPLLGTVIETMRRA